MAAEGPQFVGIEEIGTPRYVWIAAGEPSDRLGRITPYVQRDLRVLDPIYLAAVNQFILAGQVKFDEIGGCLDIHHQVWGGEIQPKGEFNDENNLVNPVLRLGSADRIYFTLLPNWRINVEDPLMDAKLLVSTNPLRIYEYREIFQRIGDIREIVVEPENRRVTFSGRSPQLDGQNIALAISTGERRQIVFDLHISGSRPTITHPLLDDIIHPATVDTL